MTVAQNNHWLLVLVSHKAIELAVTRSSFDIKVDPKIERNMKETQFTGHGTGIKTVRVKY